jgi:hypothetical protein
MNSKQREAAYRLLAAIESDAELKAEAADYGDWHAYLMKHVQEQDNDD